MNPQTTVSPAAPGRPSSGMPAVFFFLPLVGLTLYFIYRIFSTFFPDEIGIGIGIGIGGFLFDMVISLPILIGAMLIGFAGMKDWRRTGMLLIATNVLLSSGIHLLYAFVLPEVGWQNFGTIITVFNACVNLTSLAGSILLIVNRKGGSPLVRVSGLLFLCEILFAWGSGFIISWIASEIADSLEIDTYTCHEYLLLGRTLILLVLQAVAWILLAIGVIRERSAARA